ncbi:cellulose binding domain-containing protein [Solwaraspora sp. WMMD406]|uniref:cellulose binding domain-containing protein n=1 Tax=Solwaraspora sp. WMMD406 TaxID=3016095 RepID=UPI002416F35C|nr:cellulose binding domain-containing protein [Solwaraspora sp. WMMD406]MDG4763954.1 cellulose binding domain-containing protein [Solwaraspora sp. WMMD406]
MARHAAEGAGSDGAGSDGAAGVGQVGPDPASASMWSLARSGWAVALGVVLALVFGGTVWAAISRGDAPPAQLIIVAPSASLPGPPARIETEHGLGVGPVTPGPQASASPTPTPSASVSPSTVPPVRPSVPATTGAEPGAEPGSPVDPTSAGPPAAGPELTARYVLSSTWDQGFVANVDVVHRSGGNQTFEVRLSYPDNVTITVTGYWNATPTAAGSVLIFGGGPVAPGGTIRFGFQAEKSRPSQVDPVGCTVNGHPCVGF